MGDLLKYRFPNKEKQQKQGEFVGLEHLEGFEGFVVKAFVGETYFGFQESEGSLESYSNSEIKPICYSKKEYLDFANQYLEDLNLRRQENT